MQNTIASFYSEELMDFNNTIDFYYKEIEDFTNKLGEVISRNSIVGIADKVETQQLLLNDLFEKFKKINTEILQQQKALKTDSTFIDNNLIEAKLEKRQLDLRRKMHFAEKEFIDVKFGCYNFLSGTLKK